MPIGIRIVTEGDAEPILQVHKPGHGVRARAIHANLAVVIDGHEREARIDDLIDDCDFEAVLSAIGPQ